MVGLLVTDQQFLPMAFHKPYSAAQQLWESPLYAVHKYTTSPMLSIRGKGVEKGVQIDGDNKAHEISSVFTSDGTYSSKEPQATLTNELCPFASENTLNSNNPNGSTLIWVSQHV